MNANTVKLVQTTWVKAHALGDVGAALFYNTVFEKAPAVRTLFKGSDLTVQGRRLWNMLNRAIIKLDHPEVIPMLKDLGYRHVGYGVQAPHYPVAGVALLETLEKGLGPEFTPEVKAAWTEVYGVVSSAMLQGAAEAEADGVTHTMA